MDFDSINFLKKSGDELCKLNQFQDQIRLKLSVPNIPHFQQSSYSNRSGSYSGIKTQTSSNRSDSRMATFEQRLQLQEQQQKETWSLIKLLQTTTNEQSKEIFERLDLQSETCFAIESKFKKLQSKLNDWVFNFEKEVKRMEQSLKNKMHKIKSEIDGLSCEKLDGNKYQLSLLSSRISTKVDNYGQKTITTPVYQDQSKQYNRSVFQSEQKLGPSLLLSPKYEQYTNTNEQKQNKNDQQDNSNLPQNHFTQSSVRSCMPVMPVISQETTIKVSPKTFVNSRQTSNGNLKLLKQFALHEQNSEFNNDRQIISGQLSNKSRKSTKSLNKSARSVSPTTSSQLSGQVGTFTQQKQNIYIKHRITPLRGGVIRVPDPTSKTHQCAVLTGGSQADLTVNRMKSCESTFKSGNTKSNSGGRKSSVAQKDKQKSSRKLNS